MRVALLTSGELGFASLALPILASYREFQIVAVIRSMDTPPPGSKWRRTRKMVRKVLRIGLLGAANGVRMRKWYSAGAQSGDGGTPIQVLGERHGIPVLSVPRFGHEAAKKVMRDLGADLAISMGTGYLPESFYSIPRLGTINVHHEELPAFRGAQSVIWQIADGSRHSGFTIHRLDRGIDTGPIIRSERVPIIFRANLAATVAATYSDLLVRSARSLAEVLTLGEAALEGQSQAGGRHFTTPTIRQFITMLRQHRRMAATVPDIRDIQADMSTHGHSLRGAESNERCRSGRGDEATERKRDGGACQR